MPAVTTDYNLLLIRHSAVRVQKQVPSNMWALSTEGRERCRQFAPLISPYRPTLFVSSRENKAVETGMILAKALNAPTISVQNLQEHDRRNTPFFANQQAFRDAISRFFANPDQLVFGRETAAQACRRIDSAITSLVNQHTDHNLAVVTHGTVLTLFVNRHNPQSDPMTLWSTLKMPCAVLLRVPDMVFQELILP